MIIKYGVPLFRISVSPYFAAAKVGVKTIYAALLLYYTLQLPTVPAWAKTVIVGSLGYFIFPFDAIPDVVPAVGHADDLGVLAIALSSVAIHINESIKTKAKQENKGSIRQYS